MGGREDLAAHLAYLAFRDDFQKCQLLLNTNHGGSNSHLIGGIDLARRAMGPYLAGDGQDGRVAPQFRDLSRAEAASLRRELTELILLEVRAQIRIAEQAESGESLAQAYRWGIDRLEVARLLEPHPPAAFYQDRGRILALLGQDQAAARDLKLAAKMEPRTAQDFYLSGTSYLIMGQADRAELLLGQAASREPRMFWAWFALGICHGDQGRHADAVADFTICTVLAPDFAWPHLNRGLALARSGRLVEALAAYDRALQIDGEFVDAWVDRGLTYLELGHPKEALSDLGHGIELGEKSPAVLAAHAEALSRLDRREDAEKAFGEAIRTCPTDANLLVARGFSRLGHDPIAAAADFQRALDLDPRNARAHLGRAHLARTKDLRSALSELKTALDADPELADALQLRALIRARLGDPRAESDVIRLLRIPTPQRLYNAACVFALLLRSKADPRLMSQAFADLQRALETGIDPDHVARDPDLSALRDSKRFAEMLQSARSSGADGNRPTIPPGPARLPWPR